MVYNMNGYVKVKLNERGHEILRNYYTQYNPSMLSFRRPDDLGYVFLQLWELMHVYGNFVNLEEGNLPFDKCILLQYENDIVEYSIESPVNVKLTKAGIDHLEKIGEKDTEQVTSFFPDVSSEFLFVELMSKFGSLLCVGDHEIPFEIDITIPEKYLKRPSGGIAHKLTKKDSLNGC